MKYLLASEDAQNSQFGLKTRTEHFFFVFWMREDVGQAGSTTKNIITDIVNFIQLNPNAKAKLEEMIQKTGNSLNFEEFSVAYASAYNKWVLQDGMNIEYIDWILSNYSHDRIMATINRSEDEKPVPVIIAWIATAAIESVIDHGIDVAFSYITGVPSTWYDDLANLGINLFTKGVNTEAKIAKFMAKIGEITYQVNKLPLSATTKAKLVSRLNEHANGIEVLKTTFLTRDAKKIGNALNDLQGFFYEVRVLLKSTEQYGKNVVGFDVSGGNIASLIGMDISVLKSFLSARRMDLSNFQIDAINDIGNGIKELCEAKGITLKATESVLKQAERLADFAQLRGVDKTKVLYYVKEIDITTQNTIKSIFDAKGVTVNFLIIN
jgi:hypothetical protein